MKFVRRTFAMMPDVCTTCMKSTACLYMLHVLHTQFHTLKIQYKTIPKKTLKLGGMTKSRVSKVGRIYFSGRVRSPLRLSFYVNEDQQRSI